MFFGNSNPFGAFFDEEDDQNGPGGFGGGFPGMFRFGPGSQFGGAGGPGMQQQMGGQQMGGSKVFFKFKLA